MLSKTVASRIRAAIVRIEANNPEGASVGTGFLASKEGHVITCWHVIAFYSIDKNGLLQFEYADPILVTYGNQRYKANVVHRQNTDAPYTSDFAILKIDAGETESLQLGQLRDVGQGEEICFMGYPRGYDELFFGAGHVSSLRSIHSSFNQLITLDAIEIDASINIGNSGGPLVHTSSGQVVGIVTLRHGDITPALRRLRDYLRLSPGKWGIIETLTLEIVNLLEMNTNVGLGTAISIEYAKKELQSLGVKIEV